MFPAGCHIAIVEPYYKCGIDGIPFVRCDKSEEVISIIDPTPKTAAAWKEAGNGIYRSAGHSKSAAAAALECWRRAINITGKEAAVLLCNRAAARLCQAEPAGAALDCIAAIRLDPENVKATYRIVRAFSDLGLTDAAAHFTAAGHARWPQLVEFKREVQRQSPLPLGERWWEDERLRRVLHAPSPTPPAVHCSEERDRWEQLKADGNAEFAACRYDAAVQHYTKALEVLNETTLLVALLCNCSAAQLQVGEHDEALSEVRAVPLSRYCS